MSLLFLYSWILIVGSIITVLLSLFQTRYGQRIVYHYPFVSLWKQATLLSQASYASSLIYRAIRLSVRALLYGVLILLIFATSRPQTPDEKTYRSLEGISIMLALDVSESMLCFDDLHTTQNRFAIAQGEAIAFIKKRSTDLFGLVLFGAIAVTRCPLTLDHRIVTTILDKTYIGEIPPEGTALFQGILMSLRRLSVATSTSKIIVLLTDGEPSAEDAQLAHDALALARKMNVKIYTIGIGCSQAYFEHPHGSPLGRGRIAVNSRLNTELLQYIAQQTHGAYFSAKNQNELAAIYNTIDMLEKTKQSEPVYERWYEWYMPFIIAALLLLFLEWGLMVCYTIL